MPTLPTRRGSASAEALSFAAYTSFVPIGIVNVILGPLLPTLSTRWSLSYSQAGALFTAQYLASTIAVAVSGVMVSRWGFRFAMKSGLLLAAAAVALLLTGSRLLGIVCIGAIGAGLGLAVPAGNLLVAQVNSSSRSSALNVLNFCWSAGAVASPFLVAWATQRHRVNLLLYVVGAALFLVVVGIATMPSSIVEPPTADGGTGPRTGRIDWKERALPGLALLFFLYVGVENGFGGWAASYAKTLGTFPLGLALMTPSFFYFALTVGRWLAPLFLRVVDEIRLVQAGLLIACGGMLLFARAHSLAGVALSAFAAGFGLSSVYPVTIAMLSREFGSAATRVGSLMFVLSNLGGGCLPWLVGVSSSRFGTLKAGLAVPLIGGGIMFVLYLREWKPLTQSQPA